MMTERRHPTTRRAFIAAAGFGGVTLYGSWAAYGAAPGPLALFAEALPRDEAEPVVDPHAAHGATPSAKDDLTLDEFKGRVRDFVDRFGLPDGSVHPRGDQPKAAQVASQHAGGHHGGAAPTAASASGADAQDAAHAPDPADPHAVAGDDHSAPAEPVDVWLLAAQFYFEPDHLRLDAGQPYRFRMMAAETAHGASIQLGQGGRMIRLRPGSVVETEMTFQEPGDYLVSCTVYCGLGHDVMQARITVANPEGGAA